MKRWIVTLLVLVMVSSIVQAVLIETPASAAQDVCGATYNFSALVETAASVENVSFYWNNSGTLTALCSLDNSSVEGGASYSCLGDTTAITDGAANIVARAFNESPTEVEINVSAVGEVDNTGPVLSFSSDNTGDGTQVDESNEFNVSLTTDEVMGGTPYLRLAGKIYNLLNTSTTAWYYNFDRNEVPDGSYRYTVVAGEDNTSCSNTGSNIVRAVTIGKGNPAKAAAIAASRAASEPVKESREFKTKRSRQLIGLAAIAVVIYLMFFHKPKGRGRR